MSAPSDTMDKNRYTRKICYVLQAFKNCSTKNVLKQITHISISLKAQSQMSDLISFNCNFTCHRVLGILNLHLCPAHKSSANHTAELKWQSALSRSPGISEHPAFCNQLNQHFERQGVFPGSCLCTVAASTELTASHFSLLSIPSPQQISQSVSDSALKMHDETAAGVYFILPPGHRGRSSVKFRQQFCIGDCLSHTKKEAEKLPCAYLSYMT
jgi:hypothetical protein